MRHLGPLALAALVAGCGGARAQSYDTAYAAAETTTGADRWDGDDAEVMALADEGAGAAGGFFGFATGMFESEEAPAPPREPGPMVARDEITVSRKAGRKAGEYDARSSVSAKPSPTVDEPEQPPAAPEGPLVVYQGNLRLRVKRLLDAVDEITAVTERRGGYVESLTREVIIVRIPATDFEAVLAELAAVGELLDRRVKALDVTSQFTDLGARLAVARESRARLVALLAKVEDVEERLRIVQEIKRLSEQIESIESTLETLQNLVDYFTVTIELEPVLDDVATQLHRSPFSWIRALVAHRTTIEDGRDEIALELPPAFVLFEKEDVYRAQAADTTTIRAGVVDNEPRGDNRFWSAAVHHELDGRDEELVGEDAAGPVAYRIYRSRDVKPRYYLVGVHAAGEDLFVLEAFFPNEEAFQRHREAVITMLATFEVK